MENQSAQPIGIFDSGIGGLTVAKAIQHVLPGEKLIYYGDTAHLPYGDKSSELVRHYSLRIADFMLEQHAKIIVIACNTASAAAYNAVKSHVGERALVINVIDPVVQAIAHMEAIKRIGVIGTKTTIRSGTYEKKLLELNPGLNVLSLATPLFVPMIEEGFIYDNISNAIIRAYLNESPLKNLDSLILGCTHYPMIKDQIRKFYDFDVNIIDSGAIVAKRLQEILLENGLQNSGGSKPHNQFFVSDYTEMFDKIARMFFEADINLQQLNIWQ